MTDQRPLSLNLGKTQFSAGDRASVFKLPINATDVLSTARVGDDLLIKLDDGRVITIKYYVKHGANFNHARFHALQT